MIVAIVCIHTYCMYADIQYVSAPSNDTVFCFFKKNILIQNERSIKDRNSELYSTVWLIFLKSFNQRYEASVKRRFYVNRLQGFSGASCLSHKMWRIGRSLGVLSRNINDLEDGIESYQLWNWKFARETIQNKPVTDVLRGKPSE